MSGIINTLQTLRKGKTLAELDEKLRQLVCDVQEAGKAGTVTMTIKVSPASKNNADQVLIDDKVTCKSPERDRHSTLFFPDASGALHRKDPRQDELPGIGEVDKTTGEIKERTA